MKVSRFIAKIQHRLWRWFFPGAYQRYVDYNARLDEINEKLDVLTWILRLNNNICEIPSAQGTLRVVQLADAEFLSEIAAVFDKHNIPYWISSGTLMGAVRNGGFIPWDDDIDICTTREHHNRIVSVIEEVYGKNGDVFAVKSDCIRIYKRGTVCQIDVFAWDILSLPDLTPSTLAKAEKIHRKFNRKVEYDFTKLDTHERTITCPDDKTILSMTEEMVSAFDGPHKILVEGIEESHRNFFHWNYDAIFPLKTIMFEGHRFSCPNDPEALLWEIYGDFMCFPKKINGHSDIISKIDLKMMRKMSSMISGKFKTQ